MTEIRAQSLVLLAMLASLPLISWGSTSDVPAATVSGVALLVLGLVTLTVLRYVDLPDGD